MARYDVIESKVWQRDDGATASPYGASPWTSAREEPRWALVTRGYTVRDNERGTVGVGRQPWKTRAEAQAWVDKETARLDEARRAHEARYPYRDVRIVASDKAGYGPGKHVVQYKDDNGMWFDIGDPKSKAKANAALKEAKMSVRGGSGRHHTTKKTSAKTTKIHLLKTRGGNECGEPGEAHSDINWVTCKKCLRSHDALTSGHHSTKKSAKRTRKPRIVNVLCNTPAGYRWLRTHARGATTCPEGFAVTNEADWAESLRAAQGKEIDPMRGYYGNTRVQVAGAPDQGSVVPVVIMGGVFAMLFAVLRDERRLSRQVREVRR